MSHAQLTLDTSVVASSQRSAEHPDRADSQAGMDSLDQQILLPSILQRSLQPPDRIIKINEATLTIL